MQWRNGGKVPEVRKDSGRIDRSLWGRMWREKGEQLNCRLLAVPTDSYNPSLASLHVKHVIVIMDSRFLSSSTHTKCTHTHTLGPRLRLRAIRVFSQTADGSPGQRFPSPWPFHALPVWTEFPAASFRPEVFVNHCLHYLLCINLQKFATKKKKKIHSGLLTLKIREFTNNEWRMSTDAVIIHNKPRSHRIGLFWRHLIEVWDRDLCICIYAFGKCLKSRHFLN